MYGIGFASLHCGLMFNAALVVGWIPAVAVIPLMRDPGPHYRWDCRERKQEPAESGIDA